MNYPVNYDFGKNWKTKIVPHLDNPKLWTAIRKGVNNYCASKIYPRRYKKNTVPAVYSSYDYHCRLMDRKHEILIEQLRKDSKLPLDYLKLEEKENKCKDDFKGNRLFARLSKIEAKIIKQYIPWDVEKYDIESYFFAGSCHFWAPTFELTLARLVEPEEKWSVRSGELHSTVINQSETKIFDLLYWCCFGRLENYMFGDLLDNDSLNDMTLGGKQAYIDSS